MSGSVDLSEPNAVYLSLLGLLVASLSSIDNVTHLRLSRIFLSCYCVCMNLEEERR